MKAFFAYPDHKSIREVVELAAGHANKYNQKEVLAWSNDEICGKLIAKNIRTHIKERDIFICDTTILNFNVLYELGYAIALNKQILITQNATLKKDERAASVGFLGSIGYVHYETFAELSKLISNPPKMKESFREKPKDTSTPVYVLNTPRRDDFMTKIVSCVKKSRWNFKGFDPAEQATFPIQDAVEQISASQGVVIPLLAEEKHGSDTHNLRAAFFIGLAHGFSVPCKVLQNGDDPVPFDVRDFAVRIKHPDEIRDHINALSLDVTERNQKAQAVKRPPQGTLAKLDIGQSTAENEFQKLSDYYLYTNEFERALSGEVNIVVGRKGSGKTALFSQIRNKVRLDKANIVIDLKPEGYQLQKLKDNVLKNLGQGSKLHIITAFWEYILLLEITYKLLEKDQYIYMNNPKLTEPYLLLEAAYGEQISDQGDFSERMTSLINTISASFQASYDKNQNEIILGSNDVTNILYKHEIKNLRRQLKNYIELKKGVLLLIDNLDKSWSTDGLSDTDVILIRSIIDASRKIQRHFNVENNVKFNGIVFLRNDVYDQLIKNTSDRGKELVLSLDWSDPEQLRQLISLRFSNAGLKGESASEQWNLIGVSHYAGNEIISYLINMCLMRPRYLIDILRNCRASAVTYRRDKISVEDIERGVSEFSEELVQQTNYELVDVLPGADGFIYEFIGASARLTDEQIAQIVTDHFGIDADVDRIMDLLIWHGFLGIDRSNGEVEYIYHHKYNIKKFAAISQKRSNSNTYCINQIYHDALEIDPSQFSLF